MEGVPAPLCSKTWWVKGLVVCGPDWARSGRWVRNCLGWRSTNRGRQYRQVAAGSELGKFGLARRFFIPKIFQYWTTFIVFTNNVFIGSDYKELWLNNSVLYAYQTKISRKIISVPFVSPIPSKTLPAYICILDNGANKYWFGFKICFM